MRTLASPKEVEHRSSTTLREKPVKVGATVVRHGRYVTFRLAEGAVPGKSTARYKTMGWVCLDDEKPGRTGFRIRPDYQNRTVRRLLCRRGGFPSLAAGEDGWEGPIMKYAIVILAVSILAGAAPARAEVRADVEAGDKARHGGAFTEAAGLYTQAIRSGHIDGAALAGAYVKRGDTYRDQGLYDQAISDFAAALKINPGHAEALNGRGLVFAKKGLYDRAIADYGTALKLKPDFAFAYNNLGRAYFYQGNFSEAAASFENRLKIKPRHVYPMLWLYLARARMGQDPKTELAGYMANVKKGHWIYKSALLYLGKATPEQVLDAARKGNPHKRREREAEAYFYNGQDYLVNGDEKAAAG